MPYSKLVTMSTDPLWSAICDLDPAAELRYEPPGGWAVRLRSIYYQYHELAAPFLVTARKAPSREQAIERMFDNPRVAYLHLHNAKPGCYAARVDRV